MSNITEREKSFENKYANDQQTQFRVEARCSKLVGLWAADEMDLGDGATKLSYAKEVVEANLEEPGFDDVVRKVKNDFENKKIDISDHIINEKIKECFEMAKNQIMQEA